jgi:eukaryotic-like serine/threonine-protein kinase
MTHSASAAGRNGSIEPALADLVEELTARLQAGEALDEEACLRAHPQFAAQLRELLPALRVMADASRPGPGSLPDRADTAGPPAGGTLGDFRIVREVGRGGMGVVYEAEQLSLGRRVALKVLPFAATLDERQLQRFKNEARAAASLHHEHIVPVYFVGSERGVHFFAMQFIDGLTLAQVLERQRQGGAAPAGGEPTTDYPPPPAPAAGVADTAPQAQATTEPAPRDPAYFRRVAEWGVQAAEALEHAHQLGIVHRDIKPGNLMLDGQGKLWVTDFGLARLGADSGLTGTGDLLGTLRYMSPEQAQAKRVVLDHRSDVYSLGVTLYELLTGQPAVGGSSREEILRQILFAEPRRPRQLNRAIPLDLETIILTASAQEPERRYATAQKLAEDLRHWLEDKPIQARRPRLPERARRWARRHPALVRSVVVGVLVAAAVLAGSVGWVVRDLSARQAVAEEKVREALAVLEPGLRQGNPHAADVVRAARQAEAHLASGLLGPSLRQRAEELLADLAMLAKLEQTRLDQAAVRKGGGFDQPGADPAYADAFREYRIDVLTLSPREAAARIRGRAIAAHLVAALDNWARARKAGGQRWHQLLEVARQADAERDEWREALREWLARGGQKERLAKLAVRARLEEVPAPTLDFLGRALSSSGDVEAAVAVLRTGQRRYPADFWLNHDLGLALTKVQPPRLDEAIGYVRAALALRPESPAVHHNLGFALHTKGQTEEAIACYRQALRLQKDYAHAHTGLGSALCEQGKLDEAVASHREALRLKPDLPEAYHNLGIALRRQGKLGEAVACYREALRLKKDFPDAHTNLGVALRAQGKVEDAIAAYREAIRLKNDFAMAHYNLGNALAQKGQLDEAIAAYREATRLKDYPDAQSCLGSALLDKGRLEEAIAAYREAIRLKRDHNDAHYNLGIALGLQGKLDEAVAAYREAIRLKPDLADAHCNLGHTLRDQGRFADALASLQRGHQLGSRDPAWRYPSAQWVQQCERLLKLDRQLAAALSGEKPPADAAERIALAEFCLLTCKKCSAAAARLYEEAFAIEPERAGDQPSPARYSAARAAALAGCGQGKDAEKLDAKARARLRQRALDWLRAEVATRRKALERDRSKAAGVQRQLQHWLNDPTFAGVRGAQALAGLPEGERPAWRELWAQVAQLLHQAQGKETPTPK